MDRNDYLDNVRLIELAITNAESIYEEEEKIGHFKKSRIILEELNRYEQERSKLDSALQVMRSSTKTKHTQLNSIQDKLIKRITYKLTNAADIKSKLNKSDIPPDDINIDSVFDIQPYLLAANRLKEEEDKLITNKVDKLQFIDEVNNSFYQSQTELLSFIDKSILNYKQTEAQCTADINQLNQKFQDFDRRNLTNEVLNKLLGIIEKPPSKKDNFPLLVDETVRDIFGKKLIEQVILDNTTKAHIQSSVVNSLQVSETNSNSETIKNEIDTMKKEADEAFSLLEEAQCLQDSIEKLDYADHIIRNHTKVLNFLNAPDGKLNDTPYKEKAENIPPEISLYRKDSSLSTALATSIAQYTEKIHFSDLEERLARLEKEIL